MFTRLDAHLSSDELRGFASGCLDDSTADVVMSHLDSCPDCCRQVAGLSADGFLDRLRQAQGHRDTPDGQPASTAHTPGPPARTPGGSFSLEDRPPARPLADLPPELADSPQYEILRELGRGGMGVVYLARNKLLDRLEVLKVVNAALLRQPGAADRFHREIRSAARLHHPNVVTAYNAVQAGGTLAFAMEYVEGSDLARLVESRGPLPVAVACEYVRQAAQGIGHAFERNMVHRDIKPHNLILARGGDGHRVKVLDFGLAKVTGAAGDAPGLTDNGAFLGTPDYMAPEQTRDAARADIRADIYSLGCTLYHLLTGGPPFTGRSRFEVLLAHRSEDARPLNRVRPDVPEGLAAVVRKMMAKDPARRYQTPAAVAQALAPFARPGATGGGARRTRWTRWAGGIAAGVLLAAMLGLWAGGVLRVKTPEGTLVVEVDVPNPDVYVDGAKLSVSWDDGGKRAEIRVPPGTREVTVTKDGFTAHGERVTLADGKRRVLTARLDPLPRPDPAKPSPGDGRRPGEERDDNALKMKFRWCPTRTISDSPRTPGIHAQGFHLPGFWVGQYEVTQAEWASLMGLMPARPMDKGKGDRHPIYHVSHDDAVEFCRKLTDRERKAGRLPDGWDYRLPTDVQWEYACRAGTATATAFGDKLDSTQANFNGDGPHNGAAKGPNLGKAVAVGSYKPNAWGIYDMHGNVGEFTATPGLHRGGSWYDSGRNCGSEIFIPDPPNASEHVGFRVALVRN